MKVRRQLIAAAALSAAACGGYFAFGAPAVPHGAVPPPPAAPRTVRVQEVRADAAGSEQTFTGVVRPRYESDLAFRVGGKVSARLVEVGGRVRAGQVVARLDPADAGLATKAAEADLKAADADLVRATAEDARMGRLRGTGAVSVSEQERFRAERDVATARRDRARKALDLARNRLDYCALAADADGVVTALPVEAGQVVAEGQAVARVARTGEPEAVVSVPENRVAAVRAGSATVTFWSLPGVARTAALRELSPSADPVTRTYQARFTIRDPGPELALGMTATVRVAPAGPAAGFALPLSALLRQGSRPAVWVVGRDSGRLTLTPVEVARYGRDSVVLAGGVKSGDLVVTAGVQKLDAEMTVRTWEDIR